MKNIKHLWLTPCWKITQNWPLWLIINIDLFFFQALLVINYLSSSFLTVSTENLYWNPEHPPPSTAILRYSPFSIISASLWRKKMSWFINNSQKCDHWSIWDEVQVSSDPDAGFAELDALSRTAGWVLMLLFGRGGAAVARAGGQRSWTCSRGLNSGQQTHTWQWMAVHIMPFIAITHA